MRSEAAVRAGRLFQGSGQTIANHCLHMSVSNTQPDVILINLTTGSPVRPGAAQRKKGGFLKKLGDAISTRAEAAARNAAGGSGEICIRPPRDTRRNDGVMALMPPCTPMSQALLGVTTYCTLMTQCIQARLK